MATDGRVAKLASKLCTNRNSLSESQAGFGFHGFLAFLYGTLPADYGKAAVYRNMPIDEIIAAHAAAPAENKHTALTQKTIKRHGSALDFTLSASKVRRRSDSKMPLTRRRCTQNRTRELQPLMKDL